MLQQMAPSIIQMAEMGLNKAGSSVSSSADGGKVGVYIYMRSHYVL